MTAPEPAPETAEPDELQLRYSVYENPHEKRDFGIWDHTLNARCKIPYAGASLVLAWGKFEHARAWLESCYRQWGYQPLASEQHPDEAIAERMRLVTPATTPPLMVSPVPSTHDTLSA